MLPFKNLTKLLNPWISYLYSVEFLSYEYNEI